MTDTAVTSLLVVARVLHYGSALVLFGYVFFMGFLLPQESRNRRGLVGFAVIVFVASSVLWLMAEAANAGDGLQDAIDPSVIWSVLTETSFGQMFSLQLVLGIVMVLALPSGQTRMLALFSALALIALAPLGHAVMLGGLLLPITQAIHLLAGGFWIGGLAAILLKPSRMDKDWRTALMHFSSIGHAAVALVILSGITLAWVLLIAQPVPWNRTYVTLLLVKAALVIVMAGFAIYNRYALVPRFSKSPEAQVQLMQVVRLNLGLAATVILLVSLLGQLSPSIDQ